MVSATVDMGAPRSRRLGPGSPAYSMVLVAVRGSQGSIGVLQTPTRCASRSQHSDTNPPERRTPCNVVAGTACREHGGAANIDCTVKGAAMSDSLHQPPAHAGSITDPAAMFTEHTETVVTGVSLSNGRYSIGEQLGSGGSANVYRARDELLSRPVAVKLFRDEAATANDRLRQEREIRLLGELRHPGLVELYDSGSVVHRGVEHRFLVMEYIPGATLTDKLPAGPMLPRDAAALGAQVADALSFIHTRSIVHRRTSSPTTCSSVTSPRSATRTS